MFIIRGIILDLLFINIGFILSFFLRFHSLLHPSFKIYLEVSVWLSIIYLISLGIVGVYKRRFSNVEDIFKRVFLGLSLATLLSVSFIYAFRTRWGTFPTSIFLLSFFLNLFLVFITKLWLYKLTGRIFKNVVFVTKDNLKEVISPYKLKDVDEIVIKEEINDLHTLFLLIGVTKNLKAKLSILPELYEKILFEKIEGRIPHYFPISLYFEKINILDETLIRILDVILSMIIFFLSLPLFIFIPLLIKIDSPGPVFYKQKRVGKDGKIFTLYKFRTMIKEAEKKTGPVWASQNDCRVTKVGKILRKIRLDELPQLYNILKGDMSLVGPRPERPHFVKLHKALRGIRLAVKPGLTGLAQVQSYYDLPPHHKLKYDYLYIRKRSLLLNLYILAKTVPAVLSKKGW